MNEQKSSIKKPHNVIMNDCNKLCMSGICDVGSFDEKIVHCFTDRGELVIKGNLLHIDRIDLEGGNMDLSGEISALIYTGEKRKSGFISKIFK